MTATARKFSLNKILYDYRHVAFLVLIYAAEMTVWAVLNLKGLGDHNFVEWRIYLLWSVIIIVGSAAAYHGTENAVMIFAGALAPWLIAIIAIIVYGFIQMNFDFLSMNWFSLCGLASFCLQFVLIFMKEIFV
ncbi:hypothetical protein ACOQH0_23735 (plasmid) [Enterobacter sp. JS8-1]|uniref:hypothetical protein n=1 Tax=Enterobacter sp. JS8-1 TaxID=3411633 RepID=UPI003B9EC65E